MSFMVQPSNVLSSGLGSWNFCVSFEIKSISNRLRRNLSLVTDYHNNKANSETSKISLMGIWVRSRLCGLKVLGRVQGFSNSSGNTSSIGWADSGFVCSVWFATWCCAICSVWVARFGNVACCVWVDTSVCNNANQTLTNSLFDTFILTNLPQNICMLFGSLRKALSFCLLNQLTILYVSWWKGFANILFQTGVKVTFWHLSLNQPQNICMLFCSSRQALCFSVLQQHTILYVSW